MTFLLGLLDGDSVPGLKTKPQYMKVMIRVVTFVMLYKDHVVFASRVSSDVMGVAGE